VKRPLSVLLATSSLLFTMTIAETGRASAATVSSTKLTSGWALRSANGLTDTGAAISQVGYATPGWNPVT
jgi:exo-1,4-beta-D-glucosaminidase